MRLAIAILAAAVAAGPAVAAAQVWKAPKKERRPARPKQKPRKPPDPVPVPVPVPVPDPDPDADPDSVSDPDAVSDPVSISDADPDADPDSDSVSDDDSADADSFRIDDDLDDVGATVTFTDADLATDAAGPGGATRLETKALGFGRLAADTIHDPPPAATTQRAGAGEDVLAFRAHGRAESTARFGTRFKVKVAGRADAELGLDGDTNLGVERYEARIWDTHADAYFRSLDLRFGNQMIAWGTADLLSPNDVVNARDLRRGIAIDTYDLRIPTLALSARAYAGPLSLQALWIPVAPTNRFDLLRGDFAILGPHAATEVERRLGALVSALADDPMLGPGVSPILAIGGEPDNGIDTGELGAAGSIETRRLDLHGYFLWSHERNPRIQLADDLRQFLIMTPPAMLTPESLAERVGLLAEMGVPAVTVDYPRKLHVGAALATRIEPIGIKLDAAFSPAAVAILAVPGAGPVLGVPRRLPQGSATVSLDYDRGTDLSVVIEASHLRVLDVPDGEQVFQMPRGDHLTVVAAQVSWNPGAGPITLEGLGFVDVDSPSYAIRPAIELSGHDHWSVEIAATLFGGPDGSYGGIPDDADEVSITVQYGL